MIRHYLQEDPEQDMDDFIRQYDHALWLEERQMDVLTNAIGKALGGNA